MSWQDYVDNQLLASQCVTKACIAGHDGNIWAQSNGFEVTKEELSKLISGFDQQDGLTSNGVTLAGQRRLPADRVLRSHCHIVALVHCCTLRPTRITTRLTHQPDLLERCLSVIVSIYEDPVQPQQAASVVEKLGDYLITCGY
ncbi:chic [Drosophila simulans]|uniref:Profilin n=1 Tax=Drosophila simulans TaxID=7240 RepID=B4Q452_DROSI|nr:chic [Drosophila simulans]